MDDNEMQRRLELVQAAKTAILGVTNAILRVLPNAVEVCSDRTSTRCHHVQRDSTRVHVPQRDGERPEADSRPGVADETGRCRRRAGRE